MNNKFIKTLSGLSFGFQVPLLLVTFTLVTIIAIIPNISAKLCDPTDFFYQYSPCDETGQRWRYAVPKSHKLQCDNVPPPMNGLNCSFSCPPGNFLDMEMQQCKTCPPGQYSLGDGVRYEQLEKMPAGFSVENFPDESDQPIQSDQEGSDQDENSATRPPEFCSTQVGWIVQNGELRYTPTPCISKLSVSLNLVRNGYIEFFYKMPKNSRSLVAILQVRNAHCQSYGNQRSMFFQAASRLVSPTSLDEDIPVGEEGFRIRRLHIRAGQNLVTWTVAANNRELTTLADIIYVPKIDVFGLAFTPSCSNCPAGTYSQGGAHKCESCKSNTFSHKGASKCERCGALEYSAPKSSRCLRRPACQNFDFYPVRPKACKNGSRSITYEKIQPAVCVEGSSGASPTPKSESCGVCSAGMFRNSNGVCEYCKQQDEYSEDGITCKKCASNMVPEHGLFFTNWDVLPNEITTSCELITSDEGGQLCNVAPSWLAMGTQVQSAQTRATGVALELNVKVASGFFNPLRMGGSTAKATLDNPLGYISLDMQMDCADPSCQLYFVQEHANSSTTQNHFNMIAAMNGTQTRKTLSYPILNSQPTEFVLAFMRSGSALDKDVLTDKVTIYSLNITNVGDPINNHSANSATKCVVCPSRDHVTKTCQSCPNGHYWMQKDLKCVKCPAGTALNLTSSRQGPESCIACGPNLGSEDGSACSFSGRFELPSLDQSSEVMKFDLSPLRNRTLTAEGIKVYAREGNSYFHSFNVSLFGEPVYCRDSFDSGSNSGSKPAVQTTLSSPSLDADDAVFCRSAAIPAINVNGNSGSSNVFNKVLYVSSTIISRKLAAITQNRSYHGFHLSNEQLEYDTSLTSSSTARPIDVHLFYETSTTSMVSRLLNCPKGSIGVVTLRCEPTAVKDPLVRLSRKCPDGTCDGCVFHVIVESSYACPICHPDDFEEIRGECINNIQKIHSIPSKHCVLSGAQNHQRNEPCSNLSKNIKLILLSAALLIAILVVTIVVFYQRNKSLEYRYMRIIEGKEPDNANSCGMESDDEEEEDVASSGTRVFFGKKKNNNYVVSVQSREPKRTVKTDETAEFLSDSSES